MSDTTIYGLVDCYGTIRYVGKTVTPSRRLQDHRRERKWCVGMVILEVVPCGGDWSAAERKHILHWGQWGDLENVRNGGGGGERMPPRSDTHRARLSASLKGKPPWNRGTRQSPTCHPERKHQGRGMCTRCYMRDYYRRSRVTPTS